MLNLTRRQRNLIILVAVILLPVPVLRSIIIGIATGLVCLVVFQECEKLIAWIWNQK